MPYYRGLDCVKWAIYNGDIPGVTTHIIDDKVDEGLWIDKEYIKIEYTDTFHGMCYKVYETELRMLVEAIDKYKDAVPGVKFLRSPFRRMPHRLEIILQNKLSIVQNSKFQVLMIL